MAKQNKHNYPEVPECKKLIPPRLPKVPKLQLPKLPKPGEGTNK